MAHYKNMVRRLSMLSACALLRLLAATVLLCCMLSGRRIMADPDPFVADDQLRLHWHEANLCAPIAIFLALRDFGICNMDLRSIVTSLPVSGKGASMLACSEFLKNHGMETRCIRASTAHLTNLFAGNRRLRAIAFVDQRHWVYCCGTKGDKLLVFDYPAWRDAAEGEITAAILIGETSDSKAAGEAERRFSQAALGVVCLPLCGALLYSAWRVLQKRRASVALRKDVECA